MAYIALPEMDGVDESIKKHFEAIKQVTGEVGETVRILALRPDILDATSVIVRTLLLSETELDYETKETIAILVSLENGCSMCVGEHERIAVVLGIPAEKIEKVKQGIESLDGPEEKKSLLRLCVKSAKESHKVTKEEIDGLKAMGYSDSQLLEAVAIVGYFNYINTIVNSMGSGK